MAENEELGQSLHMQSLEAIQSMKGEPMGGTRYSQLYPNGIAVIDLIGPIFPRANMMTMSGATSIAQFTSDLIKTEAHADVKGIILNIDSPGGDVRGIGDAAKVVNYLTRESRKPIQAFIAGYGASAAYYIASAVGPKNIMATESGLIGSIGVVLTAKGKSKDDIEIVSSQSPYKRPNASEDEGRAVLQEQVDDLAAIFVKDVKTYRRVSQTKVLTDYGQGKVFVAPRALSQGLIDGIGTLGQFVEEMAMAKPNRSRPKASDETDVAALLTFSREDEDMALKDMIARFRASSEVLTAGQETEAQGQDATAVGADTEDKTNTPAVEAPAGSDDTPDTEDAKSTAGVVSTTAAIQGHTRESLEERFSDGAELFATQMTTDNRIFPAQAAHAASDLLNARIDDVLVGGTINFVNEQGQLAEGTREAAVRARYAAMPRHSMTQQAIAGIKAGSIAAKVLAETDKKVDENAPVSPERKKALLGQTPAGQAALDASAK